jgi:hypothetical protein
MTSWDPAGLQRLLHSSIYGQPRGNSSDYRRLSFAIERKWVRVTRFTIPKYDPPDRKDPYRRFVYEAAMRDTGNEEHGALKWRAWNWLLVEHQCLSHFELGERGLRFDVYARERRIAVECGDTDPEKFFRSVTLMSADRTTVERPGLRRFIVLPRYEDGIFEFTVTQSGRDPMSRHLRWRLELAIERSNLKRRAKHPDAIQHSILFRNGDYVPEELGVSPQAVPYAGSTAYYP